MRLYLAGPMRGLPQFNFPEFMRVATILRAAGYEVFNPAEIDVEMGFQPDLPPDHPAQPDDWSIEVALANDIQAVLESEAIVLLPGWRHSRGACLERAVAQATGRQVFEFVEASPRCLRPLPTHYHPRIVFQWDEAAQIPASDLRA